MAAFRHMAFIALCPLLGCATTTGPWPGGLGPVPAGAHVTASFDREVYFLGENILVHFCVENRGDKPFRIGMGGDYRGADRELRFDITATGEDGTAVPDPSPHQICLGGFGGSHELKPGDEWWHSLPLVRYCRFEKPGLYTVGVSHDLGWSPSQERPLPAGKARVRLVMPSPEQARAVVEEMYHPSQGPSFAYLRGEEPRQPYADFTALGYPVYLPILLERAKDGCEKALSGIAQIPSPEATQALIELLAHPKREFACQIAEQLEMRLPHFPHGGAGSGFFARVWNQHIDAQRDYFLPRSWRAEFAPGLRARARRFLASIHPDRAYWGAALLGSVGEGEDLPSLVEALNRFVVELRAVPDQEDRSASRAENAEALHIRELCQTMASACATAIRRGGKVPSEPTTPGEAIALATAVGVNQGAPPEGWEAHYARILQHPIPFCRELALYSLPAPIPESLVGPVAACFGDTDVHVLRAACLVAERTQAPQLKGPLRALRRKAKSENLRDLARRVSY